MTTQIDPTQPDSFNTHIVNTGPRQHPVLRITIPLPLVKKHELTPGTPIKIWIQPNQKKGEQKK